MRRSLPALALLVALLPLRAGAEPFRFAWPVPGKVMVKERSVKRGTDVVMSYQVSVAPAPDGKRLAVKLSGFEILQVDGHDARTPAIRKQLAGATKAASAVPTLLVGRDGNFQGITGLEEVIAKLTASLPPAERAPLRKMMASPQFAIMLQETTVQFWNVWVGMWIGADVPEGRTLPLERDVALSDGSTVRRPLTLVNQGPAGPPGNVRLSFESTVRGDKNPKVRDLLEGMLQEVAGDPRKLPMDRFQSGALYMSGEVITDPATLQPAGAAWQRRVTLQLQGQPPISAQESHEYTFTWVKASKR